MDVYPLTLTAHAVAEAVESAHRRRLRTYLRFFLGRRPLADLLRAVAAEIADAAEFVRPDEPLLAAEYDAVADAVDGLTPPL